MEHPVLLVSPADPVTQRVEHALANTKIPFIVEDCGMGGMSRCEELSPSLIICPAQCEGFDGILFLTEISRVMPDTLRALTFDPTETDIDIQDFINKGICQYFFTPGTYATQIPFVVEGARRKYLQGLKQIELAGLLQKKNVELETMTHQLETIVDQRTGQIEKAKREWEKTFDAIIDPLTLIDEHFTIIRANVAAAIAADADIRAMPGQNCHEALFHKDDPCKNCPLIASKAWPKQGGVEAEIEAKWGEGMFRLSAYLMDPGSDDNRYICYYKDITEEKRLQKQVAHAEKMAGIGQLAGGVAHELNNPIGVILSFTQLSKLPAKLSGDEELLDNLDEIEKAANRCKKIITNLLEFSRPSLEKGYNRVGLNETMESALFLVSTQRAIKELPVEKQYAQEEPFVRANSNELLQVFINLIQNAAQSMDDSGQLTLATGTAGPKMAYAQVTDTGCGIDPKDIERVFEPFFTTKDPGKGTGLGLSVTYSIIERHEGLIDVRSEPFKGTTFEVRIPLWVDDDEE